MDDTLVAGNTGFYASLRLVRHGILKKRRIPQAVYYRLANLFFPQDVRKIYEIAVADMAGTPLDTILTIGRECLERDIRKRLYPEGIRLIEQHRSAGDQTILLTSGPYMIIEPLREFFGVDRAYSSGPVIENGIRQNRLRLPLCFGEGKLFYAGQAAAELGVKLGDCTFYSNDLHDLPLLEKIGRPVATNPDKRLERIARQRGWEILSLRD